MNVTAIPPTGCTKPDRVWLEAFPTVRSINFYLLTSGYDKSALGNYWVSLEQWPRARTAHLYLQGGAGGNDCAQEAAECRLANTTASAAGEVRALRAAVVRVCMGAWLRRGGQ